MIPLKLGVLQDGTYTLKYIWEIMDPDDEGGFSQLTTEAEKVAKAIELKMFPTDVALSAEAYSRDAERTADYELEKLQIVNAKSKPEFTWSLLKASYVQNLLTFLGFKYNYKQTIEGEEIIVPEDAPTIVVQYIDFIGQRTINAYLGETINGTLVCYNEVLYWENFRIAFPER